MSKKAIVFDNSGTLLERYRVIKNISSGELFSNINSLDLIDSNNDLALVVLQFNTSCLEGLNSSMLISDLIKKHNIDLEISYSNKPINKEVVYNIINNDFATIKDITDGFEILKEKIPKMELCNGSALILDIKNSKIAYTITSAGKLFPEVIKTIRILQKRGIKIYIASGDRKGAIKKLASIIDIKSTHAFGTANTQNKCEIIKALQNAGYKVMMVGDGPNDILAFEAADVSVLTIEQKDEVSPKLLNEADFIIKNISQVTEIDF